MRKGRKYEAAHSRKGKGVMRGVASSAQPFHRALQILYMSSLSRGPHSSGKQEISGRVWFLALRSMLNKAMEI